MTPSLADLREANDARAGHAISNPDLAARR